MKILENFGVQELNAKEIKRVSFDKKLFLTILLLIVIAGVIADWDNFKLAILGGF